jgi:hypothetical protein
MNSNTLRILGSVLLVVGYFLVLYVDMKIGCTVRLVGNLAMIPFAVKIRTWDVVVLEAFFSFIDLSKIIELSL